MNTSAGRKAKPRLFQWQGVTMTPCFFYEGVYKTPCPRKEDYVRKHSLFL
jgi:hypothetical protein